MRTACYELFIRAGGTLKPFRLVGLVFGPDADFYVASVGSSETLRYNGTTGSFLEAFLRKDLGGITRRRTITWKVKTLVWHQPGGNPAKSRTLTTGIYPPATTGGTATRLVRADHD